MIDPVRTLLAAIEGEVGRLATAQLVRRASALDVAAFAEAFGRAPPAGLKLFLAQYDGGTLGVEIRILSFQQSVEHMQQAQRVGEVRGLWPVIQRGGRLFALDSESPGTEGEWPVVEITEGSIERVGSSFLRYLHGLLGELAWEAASAREGVERDGEGVERNGEAVPERQLLLLRELCRRDPYLAEHWVNLAERLQAVGRKDEAADVLQEGLRIASPVGPSLMLALGLQAVERDDEGMARAAFEDSMALDPMTVRDDDARLDGAAMSLVMALERQDTAAAARAREVLGPASASTAGFWRGEALRCLADGNRKRALFALRIVKALLPEDADTDKLAVDTSAPASMARSIARAREALDRGAPEEAVRAARAAVAEAASVGVCHVALAEALNAMRDKGAVDAAREATLLNPALLDGWRELGDSYLEARQASKAEESYRELLRRDPNHGLGLAKLAQALLEQGKTSEALESITAADERGGDPFFLAAVRGDILAEMNRHGEAAEAYDLALRIEPEDHWALHQAALEHSRAGDDDRAVELFERALRFDRDGCHQTLIDYADLMRRRGRIGDAVRLYRRAVAAVPGDSHWRQSLREAERELQLAPN